MVIYIKPEEFLPEYRDAWRQDRITGIHIDYATNALHGFIPKENTPGGLEYEEIIFFYFKPYGWFNDNRFTDIKYSVGSAGVILEINRTD